MKIKTLLLGILLTFSLSFIGTSYQTLQAQDTPQAPEAVVVDQPAIVEVSTDTPADTVVVTDPITQADVAQSYLKYFANPVMFMMLVVLLTGLLSRAINLTAAWKIYSSWIIAAVLGIIGSLASWGMFVGIDVLHSIILALSAAGFTNVVYAASGAFTGIEGKKS